MTRTQPTSTPFAVLVVDVADRSIVPVLRSDVFQRTAFTHDEVAADLRARGDAAMLRAGPAAKPF
jgi:hypothetical protein